MKKLRSDSKWQGIPPQAREEVARWLFEEGISYDAALKRARQRFGIKSSLSGMARFYRHVAVQRQMAGLDLPPVGAGDFREGLRKLVSVAAFNAGLDYERPEIGKTFGPLVKLVLQHEDGDLKSRKLKLEQERLALARSLRLKK